MIIFFANNARCYDLSKINEREREREGGREGGREGDMEEGSIIKATNLNLDI